MGKISLKNKTIYIKAVDTLGNKSTTEITGINVDRNNPTVTINESIVYVNASTKSLSISVEPSDSGSGVKAVSGDYGSEIKKETNGTYTISLNVGDLKKENIPSTGTSIFVLMHTTFLFSLLTISEELIHLNLSLLY